MNTKGKLLTNRCKSQLLEQGAPNKFVERANFSGEDKPEAEDHHLGGNDVPPSGV